MKTLVFLKISSLICVSAGKNDGPPLYRGNAGDCTVDLDGNSHHGMNQHRRILMEVGEKNNEYEKISRGEWYEEQAALLAEEVNTEAYTVGETGETGGDGPVMTANRKRFWENFKKVDDWKDSNIFEPGPDDRPVLSQFKYIVLPIWWSDENENDPDERMDLSTIQNIMDLNNDQYDTMSFDSINVSYQILDQTKFTISSVKPGFGDTETAATEIVNQSGNSYDGIILVYHTAQDGPFQGGGGWGNVNGPFIWMSYRLGFSVTRHEIGHNFGHPHHISMRGYRECGGECGLYDGFDMMSGGNHYDISDFHVASKWFFNWVPESSIIIMQPEGSTNYCPNCVDSVSNLKLKTFDKYLSPPGDSDIFGVHIPVFGLGSNKIYSYWLQYRSGNDGDAAIGLSIHASWFTLGGLFGASYDQHNYDAHGDSVSTFDSFVLPGTCYVIEPALAFMRIDPFSSEQVVPKVCIKSLNQGSDITISVEFLDPSVVSLKSKEFTADGEGFCNFNNFTLATQMTSNSNYLFQMKGTGLDGEVTVGLCPDSSNDVTAYFYDRYPYAPLHLNAPYAYGSYDSFTANGDSCRDMLRGQNESITKALGWRIITHKSKTSSGWALDIRAFRFYSDARCNGRSEVITNGIAIDSGNAGGGWGPENAFASGTWGGRKDDKDEFWLGMVFDKMTTVKCVELIQRGTSHFATEYTVEAKIQDTWELVSVKTDLSPSNDPVQISWVKPKGYKSHTSESELGNMWILFAPGIDSMKTKITLECSMTECQKGEVEEDGKCIWRGPDRSITKALGWRILTHKSKTGSGWALDINELDFYSETSCDENSKVIPNGIAIDSGNAGRGWGPEKAFDNSGSWGGRSDDKDEFWLGMVFDEMTTVKCMGVIQSSTSHFATEWTVQANVKGSWQEVWVKKDIGPSNNPIQISWVITTDAPSFAPTETLSSSPSKADDCTDILKKLKCNKNEACAFGRKKVKKCIPKDEIDCSKYPNLNKCVKGGVCKYVDNACVHKCGGLRKNKCKIMKKTNKNLKICVFKGVSNRCWKCNPKNCVP